MRIVWAAGLLAACGGEGQDEVLFADGFRSGPPGAGVEDASSTPIGPYRRGTTINLRAYIPEKYQGSGRLEFYSTDEETLDITSYALDEDTLVGTAEALAEGEARLQVWVGDTELASTTVEVLDADNIEVVHAAGSLMADEALTQERPAYQVLLSGTAGFKLRYMRENREIHGFGSLEAYWPETVGVELLENLFGRDGDFMLATATTSGSYGIELHVDRVRLGIIDVQSVDDPGDMAQVVLATESDEGAVEGEELVAGLFGFLEDGTPVHGLDGAWTTDGSESGVGEAITWVYGADGEATVEATAYGDSLSAAVSVPGEAKGCSTAPGAMALWLGGLVVLFRRRRED